MKFHYTAVRAVHFTAFLCTRHARQNVRKNVCTEQEKNLFYRGCLRDVEQTFLITVAVFKNGDVFAPNSVEHCVQTMQNYTKFTHVTVTVFGTKPFLLPQVL